MNNPYSSSPLVSAEQVSTLLKSQSDESELFFSPNVTASFNEGMDVSYLSDAPHPRPSIHPNLLPPPPQPPSAQDPLKSTTVAELDRTLSNVSYDLVAASDEEHEDFELNESNVLSDDSIKNEEFFRNWKKDPADSSVTECSSFEIDNSVAVLNTPETASVFRPTAFELQQKNKPREATVINLDSDDSSDDGKSESSLESEKKASEDNSSDDDDDDDDSFDKFAQPSDEEEEDSNEESVDKFAQDDSDEKSVEQEEEFLDEEEQDFSDDEELKELDPSISPEQPTQVVSIGSSDEEDEEVGQKLLFLRFISCPSVCLAKRKSVFDQIKMRYSGSQAKSQGSLG